MEILHECKSQHGEGALIVLPLSPFKTPRRSSVREMGERRDPMVLPLVPYFENYYCDDCGVHVRRSMPPKED